jgi:hypothetical protein
MKFYSIKQGKAIMVPKSSVTYRMTSNGRRQAVGTHKGEKLYKFVK